MAGLSIPKQSAPPCQLCGSQNLQRFVVPDRLKLWHCQECGLYQYGEVADNSAYAADYHLGYEHHREKKLRTAVVRLNRIAAVLNTDLPRLLDIGCSVGCTVEAAKRRGWHAIGVDVSDDAVAYCKQRGLNCHVVDHVKLPFNDETFDVVTSWHVVEHVSNVTETLNEWRRVLRPGGVLVMETPDANCLKVRLKGADYRRFWAPEHTYTFTPDSLARFVERCDLVPLQRPMLGRLADLSPAMAAYTIMYQSYQALRHITGMSKAFQRFARRPDRSEHYRQDLPAAA